MLETGKDVRAFFSIRTDERHASFERSVTATDKGHISILGSKKGLPSEGAEVPQMRNW